MKLKIELKRESFENSPRMERFKERKFLLVVINVMQAIIILLMLGLLLFMAEEKEAEQVSTFLPLPDLSCLMEKESVDGLRLLMDLLGVGLIPLLAWLVSKASVGGWDGVCRWPWGDESLLREGGDGLWYFGPKD